MSDVMSDEARAIIAKFAAGEILTDDEIAKLPDEIEIDEDESESDEVEESDIADLDLDWDAAKVAVNNNQNMKQAGDDDVLSVMFADEWILIGEHDRATVAAFSAALHPDGIAAGTASVTPPKGAFNPGTIIFRGLDGKRQEITTCVAGFSKRKVSFE